MKPKIFIKFTLTALLLVGVVTSCQDYLEVNPVSSFGPDYVFSNVTNATKAVLGVYASLGGDQGYGIRVSMYYPYDNDEMMGQGGTPYPDNERRDIAHFNVQPSNTQLAAPFNQMYAGIEKANLCIYYIPRMDMYASGTESEKRDLKRLHGEALTLRAQFYQELIRNWGDVPAHFQPSSLETDLFKFKANRDEIYDQILGDLAEASALLPWRNEASGSNERITQGYARGLRARIALAAAGYSLRTDGTMQRHPQFNSLYQIALDETSTIIQRGDHRLNPSFVAIFKDALCAHQDEPFGEILWEVGMTGGSSANGDSKLGYYNGPRYNNMGNSALTVLPTTFYAFDEDDLRRDVTCAIYNVNENFTIAARRVQEIVDGKFRRDWIVNPSALTSTAQYFGVNWPMMRYSDVLLMFAEAENEINGPTGAAYDAVNQVRRRGFGKPIGTPDASVDLQPGLSKADFFSALMKERMLELCGEGIRKYDLIRWNMLGSRLDQIKSELAAMAARQAPYDNLPTTMYYQANSTSLVWLNSFYEAAPGTPPAGSASVDWVTVSGTGITNTILPYYAISFVPGKSELLPIHTSILDANPNLKQDYGY